MSEVNEELTKINPALIEGQIKSEVYFSAHDGIQGADATDKRVWKFAPDTKPEDVFEGLKLVTFCILTLKNGFTLIGKSAVADPQWYDQDIGRSVARADAFNQAWPVMGYALKSRLAGVNGLT